MHCCSCKKRSCTSEDISISGVVIKQAHLDQALVNLQSSHSDSIGAPKVITKLLVHDKICYYAIADPQCELGRCGWFS